MGCVRFVRAGTGILRYALLSAWSACGWFIAVIGSMVCIGIFSPAMLFLVDADVGVSGTVGEIFGKVKVSQT